MNAENRIESSRLTRHHVADLRETEGEEHEQVAGQVHRGRDEDRPPARAPLVDERGAIRENHRGEDHAQASPMSAM